MILACILVVTAAIHLYWAAGGKWGAAQAIPRLAGSNEPLFIPGAGATIAVAGLLMLAASISAGLVFVQYRVWLMRAMAAVFALRAIGEFHYIGFLKRVRDTEFAYWDTRLYSPLCVAMALLALLG